MRFTSARSLVRAQHSPLTLLRSLWSLAFAEGIALSAYALLVEPARLHLSGLRVMEPGLDRPRRYLLLSDTHLRPWSHRTFRGIARAADWALRSGATHALLAGDVLEDDREAEAVAVRLRHALGALRPVYITGNHELLGEGALGGARRNDPAAIAVALERRGIERIDDRIAELDGVPFVGVPWRSAVGPGSAARAILARASRAVVLTHSPDQVMGLPADRVIVALCGHTHGGQVRLPIVGAPWVPVRSRLPRLAGRMTLDGVPAYVSRGIGATIPVRLGAVPEATLVEIAPPERR